MGDSDELQRKYPQEEIRSSPRPSPRRRAEQDQKKNTEGGGMEGIAECDGMPVCVVLTKQYWWAETPPFDMISPPSSADSELPPQNIHRILSPICSVSAINVVHLCHVHARKGRAKWPCNVTLMRMRSIGVITRTCLRNCELWS